MKKSILIAVIIACFGIGGLAYAVPAAEEKPAKKEMTAKKEHKKHHKNHKKEADQVKK